MSLLAKSDRLKYIHRCPPLFWAKWAKLNRYEVVISTQLGQDDVQMRSLLADSVILLARAVKLTREPLVENQFIADCSLSKTLKNRKVVIEDLAEI